jgi:hypothetical protein
LVEFIPDEVAMPFASPSEDATSRLEAVGELIEGYHQPVADSRVPDDGQWNVALPAPTVELIAYHHLAP